MSASPIEQLTPSARDSLHSAGRERSYARGATVFHVGDAADSVHILTAGRIAVRTTTPDGQEFTLSVMGPGEFFGEMALFVVNGERAATVVALEDAATLELRRAAFDEARRAHAEINDLFLKLLAERTARLNDLVQEAHFIDVDQRIARRLYEVGRQYLDEKPPVSVPLTQTDIANLAGTTRPTANQALKELESRGMIALSRGRVDILDPRALRRRAGL